MQITILGTGTMARALGSGWLRSGHTVTLAGRSDAKAHALAAELGANARSAPPREAAADSDAILLAVSWDGVDEMLELAGARDGALAGATLIDCTNAVEHGVGVLLAEPSAAEHVASRAPGANVVKALHLFAGEQWLAAHPPNDTVVICGDDADALATVGSLVRDLGGVPATLGGLDRARQLEEVAGFVIGLVFAGADPSTAVPRVPTG